MRRAYRRHVFKLFLLLTLICLLLQWTGSDVILHVQLLSTEALAYLPLLLGSRCSSDQLRVRGISTPSCEIPAIEVCSDAVRHLIRPLNPLVCGRENLPSLTYVKGDLVIVNSTAVRMRSLDLSYCKAWPILPRFEDDTYRYGPMVVFKQFLQVKGDFVRVYCFDDGERHIYTNFHYLVYSTISTVKMKPVKPAYNVLVMGIDSVSRVNLHRQLPRTVQVLRQSLDAVEMQGYHKVGGSTFANLIPMLAGMNGEDIVDEYFHQPMNLSLVWTKYKRRGFVTMFGEDAPDMAFFDYGKRGFANQPTDLYFRPMSLAMYEEWGWYFPFNKKCAGGIPEASYTLNWMRDGILEAGDRPWFVFGWFSRMQHDSVNDVGMADDIYADFLLDMSRKGVLDKALVLVVSDHGTRYGPFRRSAQGALEDRLPFLWVALPTSMKEKRSSLVKNAQSLTTTYDIHATLQHLLDPTYTSGVGFSLLNEFPATRGCSAAGIPASICVCNLRQSLQKDDQTARQAAEFVVNSINTALNEVRHLCHDLHLSEVRRVSATETQYQVQFGTQPGGAVFEATVEKTSQSFKLLGSPERVNEYGSQSHCVSKYSFKSLCICK